MRKYVQRDEGRKKSFNIGKKRVEVWDLSGFEIAGSPHKLRVVRYRENGKKKERKANAGCGL